MSSHRSSGYLAKSGTPSRFVSCQSSPMIQPMWAQMKPCSPGEWTSPCWSLCLWWWRWLAAHQSGPFCTQVRPQTAITNWNARLVLKLRCEK